VLEILHRTVDDPENDEDTTHDGAQVDCELGQRLWLLGDLHRDRREFERDLRAEEMFRHGFLPILRERVAVAGEIALVALLHVVHEHVGHDHSEFVVVVFEAIQIKCVPGFGGVVFYHVELGVLRVVCESIKNLFAFRVSAKVQFVEEMVEAELLPNFRLLVHHHCRVPLHSVIREDQLAWHDWQVNLAVDAAALALRDQFSQIVNTLHDLLVVVNH
jgi:hypothetical protein